MTTHVDLMTADEVETHAAVEDAGVGTLGTVRGNLPLEKIDLRGAITGLSCHTLLTQGFRNPFDEPLEATYIFPLPSRSAVTALRMEADDRVIEGILKERGAARAEYDEAVQAGKRASIAEEERPGVFTMRVGNIMPGERVTVRLTLVGQLPYEDGEATFRFPLVVAPRYVPGRALGGEPVGTGTAEDTDAVPDASRISPPVLLPGFPNPIQLTAEIEVDPASLPLTGVRSSLPVTTDDTGERLRIQLNPGARADRDFVLRFALGAEDAVTTALAVAPDADGGGTFALTLLPPVSAAPARPRDVVVVLDRSGSMAGWKMLAAQRAAAHIIDTLTGTDRFAVVAFDHVVEGTDGLPPGLVAATDRHRTRAVDHLGRLTARGGTEMLAPLEQAASMLAATDGERDRALILITDGQIANEDQLLRSLTPRLAGVRVYTVGVDTAVNEAFLRRLAAAAGGRCELVESKARLDEALVAIHRRISGPLVTDLELAATDGLAVDQLVIDEGTVSPTRLPDLFVGAPVVITGRFSGAPVGTVTVGGRAAGGSRWRETVTAVATTDAGLPAVWARGRVRDLEDRYVTAEFEPARPGELDALERELVETSVRYGVLCRFTAFVAVDSRVVTDGGTRRQITQPVDAPADWNMTAYAAGVSSTPMATTMAFAAPMEAPMLGAAPESLRPSAPLSFRGGRAVRSSQARPGSGTAPKGRSERATAPADPARTFAAEYLIRLRNAAERPFAERVALLAELAADLRAEAAALRTAITSTALDELVAELARPITDPAELERRWLFALDALENLTGDGAGRAPRPFWKR